MTAFLTSFALSLIVPPRSPALSLIFDPMPCKLSEVKNPVQAKSIVHLHCSLLPTMMTMEFIGKQYFEVTDNGLRKGRASFKGSCMNLHRAKKKYLGLIGCIACLIFYLSCGALGLVFGRSSCIWGLVPNVASLQHNGSCSTWLVKVRLCFL